MHTATTGDHGHGYGHDRQQTHRATVSRLSPAVAQRRAAHAMKGEER